MEFSIEQLSYCIVMVVGSIGALYHVVQQSRCTRIKCCGASCERFVTEETVKRDAEETVKRDNEENNNNNALNV